MDRLHEVRDGDSSDDLEMGNQGDATPEVGRQMATYQPITESLQRIRNNTTKLKAFKEREKKLVKDKDRQELMQQINTLLTETSGIGTAVKQKFESIRADNVAASSKAGGQTSTQIRNNLYTKNLQDFQGVMKEFNEASDEFKKSLQDRTRRELRHVGITDETEIEKVIDSGNAHEVLNQAMTSENLEEMVLDIQNRHSDILKLEHQVNEVQELFLDLANLVNIQGQTIDNIDSNIQQAFHHTENAAESVREAEVYQTKARKRQCCLLVIVLVILMVILGPVLGTQLTKNS